MKTLKLIAREALAFVSVFLVMCLMVICMFTPQP